MNRHLKNKEYFEHFRQKIINESNFLQYINKEKLDIYRDKEVKQISIWLHPKKPYDQSTRGEYTGECKHLVGWIEDEFNINTEGLIHTNIVNYDYPLYRIIIWYN